MLAGTRSSAIALLMLFASTQQVFASIQVQAGDYVQMTDGLGGYGGVFYAQEKPSTGSDWGDKFATFCVETREHISLPGVYYVESLGPTADKTGNVLTDLAGWIYADYLAQQLCGQPATSASDNVWKTFNNCVQLAIWYEVLSKQVPLQSLATSYIQGGQQYYDLDLVEKILSKTSEAHVGGGHGVQIMRLRTSALANAGYVQDQLVRNDPLPNSQLPTPEATSLIVWAGLISCVNWFSRHQRSNASL